MKKGYPGIKATGMERSETHQSDGRANPRGITSPKHLRSRRGKRKGRRM